MSALPLHATDRPPCIALLSRVLDMRYLVPAFQALRPDIAWRTADDLGDPADIDAAVCWLPPAGLLGALPNLRLIQSIGAGVDHIYADPAVPRHVPVCRVAEAGMAAGMSSYVAWAVINHHRHFPDYVRNHAQGCGARAPSCRHRNTAWPSPGWAGWAWPPRARAGGAGLSRLGLEPHAQARSGRGHHGLSRRRRPAGAAGPGRHAGLPAAADGRDARLPGRRDLRPIAARRHVVNAGRGEHLDPAALLAALDSGQLSYATLDATPQEPLPPDHALWRHPKVMITPHIATRTPAAAIARQTLDNLAALQAGRRPDTCADAALGY